MPECLHAEEELGNEVVVVSQELGWVVEEKLVDPKEAAQLVVKRLI